MDSFDQDTAKQSTLSTQRQISLKITTPDPDLTYSSIDLAEVVLRIPDDLDLATIDQIAAKLASNFGEIVDHAIVATGRSREISDKVLSVLREHLEPQTGTAGNTEAEPELVKA